MSSVWQKELFWITGSASKTTMVFWVCNRMFVVICWRTVHLHLQGGAIWFSSMLTQMAEENWYKIWPHFTDFCTSGLLTGRGNRTGTKPMRVESCLLQVPSPLHFPELWLARILHYQCTSSSQTLQHPPALNSVTLNMEAACPLKCWHNPTTVHVVKTQNTITWVIPTTKIWKLVSGS